MFGVWPMTSVKMSISHNGDDQDVVIDDSVYGRFKVEKDAARERMDVDELTNHDFMSILLDVYTLHLEDTQR